MFEEFLGKNSWVGKFPYPLNSNDEEHWKLYCAVCGERYGEHWGYQCPALVPKWEFVEHQQQKEMEKKK